MKKLSEQKRKLVEEIVNSDKINEIYFDVKQSMGHYSGNLGNKTYFNNSNKVSKDKYSSLNLLYEQIMSDKRKKIEESLEK